MAKTKHNHILDTIDEIITDGKKKGVLHLYTEDETFSGRHIQINGKKAAHFGTTGYLGLEQDMRLKQAAIEAILKYGTQFPLSKTYLSMGYYKELEECLFNMYNYPTLVTKNSTLGHVGVIPSVVRDEDAVILDHQVHSSVQGACQLLKPRGIQVELIRHSNLNMLEDQLKKYVNKYKKVWHMIDGVYSMYGDCAPLEDLIFLLDKYSNFNLYVDDVHGMSWAGKNGTGYVLSKIKTLHPKMILMGTLSKSFGASGAVVVFPEEEICRKVKTFGGPQTFSAQLEPASVAAAVASAKIHLSPEIYDMQNELAETITYCNELLQSTDLPVVEINNCPVFFIATGLPAVGYNLTNRMLNDGYYVNLGIFPAVPVKNTGIRFTISRHNKKEDVKGLVEAFVHHYPKALEDENHTHNKVRKAFNLPPLENQDHIVKPTSPLNVQHEQTIKNIDKSMWDLIFANKGTLDWEAMSFMEECFAGNSKPEENWIFDYFIVKDNNNKIVLATFFTTTIWKDDMLAPYAVSKELECQRARDPYYLTSKVISMGSLLTDGEHLYVDKTNQAWKDSLHWIFDELIGLQEKYNTSMLVLRDFEDSDTELKEFFLKQGFIKIDMPDTCIIDNLNWKDKNEYLQQLSVNSRANVRKSVLRYEHYFDYEVKNNITEGEIKHFYNLYLNVKAKNFDLNTFAYPEKMIRKMSEYKGWEYVIINIKPEFDTREEKKPIAVVLNYITTSNIYNAVIIGMDYEYNEKFQVYRQAIYILLNRAKELNCKSLNLGISASIEKRKFGARVISKIAYIQTKDNFALEFIESFNVRKASA